MNTEPTFKPEEIDPDTGLTYAELEREVKRREAVVGANVDPLPGPLALAFPAQPIRVGTFSIRPLVGVDICTLRHLDSPLLKQMAEAQKPKEERTPTKFTDEDGWEMVLQFMYSPEQAEAEVNKSREQFRQQARELVGLRMNPIVINLIVEAVSKQFANAFITAVQFNSNTKSPADNDAFFTRPPAQQKTASAGGLNTSAA
jgi:hypothetical protein